MAVGIVRRGAVSGLKVRSGMCGGGFASSSVPINAVVWTDPTDDSTITHATNAVSALRSKIGTFSFDQSTSGLKPTRVAAGGAPLNGRQHLDFDGGDVLTYLNDICTGQSGEVWYVVDVDATTGSQAVFAQVNAVNTPYDVFYAMCIADKPGAAIHNSGSVHIPITTNTFGAGTTLIIRIYSTSTAYGIEINGVAETVSMNSGSNDGRWFGDHSTDNACNIGAYTSAASQGMNGQLGDIILIDGATLTTAEADKLRRFLAVKYDVTL